MDDIMSFSTPDKIILYNYIRANYAMVKDNWPAEKVMLLQAQINFEMNIMDNFKPNHPNHPNQPNHPK